MKKVLAFLAIMLLPLSVMAMTPVSDNDLANVTGQSGVSINVDVTMDLGVGVAAWGDDDGFGSTYTQKGWVGIKDMSVKTLHIFPRSDYVGASATDKLQFLTIDVGSDGTTTKVRIGIPTLSITMTTFDATVALGEDTGTNFNEVMGTLYAQGLNVVTHENGAVSIWAHSCGVSIGLENVQIDEVDLAVGSWGDSNGFSGTDPTFGSPYNYGKAGYVGITSLKITTITVSGQIGIDVGSPSDTTSGVAGLYQGVQTAAGCANCTTVLAINFEDDLTFTMDSMSGQVELGTAKTLGDSQVLGDIYVGDVTAKIYKNSYVHILAH